MAKVKNILCVDRDKIIRSLVENCVAVIEVEVTGVETADEALKLLNTEGKHFDLILTELLLPHSDGIEFIQKVKGMAHLSHLPIIVVSSITDEDRVVTAMQSGAREYITKPFASEDLLMKIVATLGLEHRI